jgi:drug/metabolite transporter (DMT)-like permease
MEPWYLFSVAALLLLGTQRFLYKVAAARDCSSALTTAVFMATVTLLSSAVYFATEITTQDFAALILLSLLNSSSFAFATIAHIEALRHLPASITFTLTRLSLVVVIFASIVFFGERLATFQWFGVLLAFSVVVVLAKEVKGAVVPKGDSRVGLFFVFACILCGAIASISSKLAADSLSVSGFMALSYLFGTFFSLAIEKKWGKRKAAGKAKDAIIIGIVMGVLNFLGFYAFLTALSRGPLASIALITGMHFVIAIILSVLIYKEHMSLRCCLGIGLTLLAIFFLQQ